MKSIFTTRVLLIALIFGSSGYGLKTLFPIEHCDTYKLFPALGFIVAMLTSLLVSILTPSNTAKTKKLLYNLVLVASFFSSIISTIVFLNAYNKYTFHPKELQISADSIVSVIDNDTVRFFQSGRDGLVPDLKEALKNDHSEASDIYYNAGGYKEYLAGHIWTKSSMDRSAIFFLLYYFFFIITLIATTFAFLEVLKKRNYSENATKRKTASKKPRADE